MSGLASQFVMHSSKFNDHSTLVDDTETTVQANQNDSKLSITTKKIVLVGSEFIYNSLPFPLNLIPTRFIPSSFVKILPPPNYFTTLSDLPPYLISKVSSFLANPPIPKPFFLTSNEILEIAAKNKKYSNANLYRSNSTTDNLFSDTDLNNFFSALKMKIYPILSYNSIRNSHFARQYEEKVLKQSLYTLGDINRAFFKASFIPLMNLIYGGFLMTTYMQYSVVLSVSTIILPNIPNCYKYGKRLLSYLFPNRYNPEPDQIVVDNLTNVQFALQVSCVFSALIGIFVNCIGLSLVLSSPHPFEAFKLYFIDLFHVSIIPSYLRWTLQSWVFLQEVFKFPDLLTFFIRLVGIETNPGPTEKNSAFIQPVCQDNIFKYWMVKGKSAIKVFKANEVLFQELSFILFSTTDKDIERCTEILSSISFNKVIFTRSPARSRGISALSDHVLDDDSTLSTTPIEPLSPHMNQPTISTSTKDIVVLDPTPVEDFVSYMKNLAIALLAEDIDSEKTQSLNQAILILDKFQQTNSEPISPPLVNHMFSSLSSMIPTMPEINVGNETRAWADQNVQKLVSTMKDFKLDIGGPTIDSLNTILIGALVSISLLSIDEKYRTEISKGILLIASIYVTYKYAGSYFLECYNTLLEYFTPQEIEVHMDTPIQENALSALTGLVYYTLYKTTPPKKVVSEFISSVGNFPRFRVGLSDMFEELMRISRDFINWLSNKFGKGDLIGLPTKNQHILDSAEQLNSLQTSLRLGEAYTRANADKLFRIEHILRAELINLDPRDRQNIGEIHCIDSLLRNIENLSTNFVGYANDGNRIPPSTILIIGPSGAGKTVNTKPLYTYLAARIFSDEQYDAFIVNPGDFIYHTQPEVEFKDGFRGQQIFVQDETLAQRDSVGNPSVELIEHMRTTNTAPYNLPMANCNAKGNFFADPLIKIGTGNISNVEIYSLTYPEAYINRWHSVFVQTPKEIYCKSDTFVPNDFSAKALWLRKLDPNKIPYNPNAEEFDLDTCDYFEFNLHTGLVKTTTPMTFSAVCELTYDRFEQHFAFNNKLSKFHTNYASSLKALRHNGLRVMNHAAGTEQVSLVKDDDKSIYTTPVINYSTLKDFSKMRAYNFKKLSDLFEKPVLFTDTVSHSLDMAYYKAYLDPVYDQYHLILAKCKELFSTKNALIAATVAISGALLFWNFAKPTFIVPHSGKTKVPISKRAVQSRSRKTPTLPTTSESLQLHDGSLTQNHIDLVNLFMKNNTYNLTYGPETEPESEKAGFITFLDGIIYIMNKHFWDRFARLVKDDPTLTLKFKLYQSDYSFTLSFAYLLAHEKELTIHFAEDSEDIMFLRLPEGVGRRHKSMRKHMISEVDNRISKNFYGSVVKLNDKLDGYNTYMTHFQPLIASIMSDKELSDFDSGYKFTVAFKYDWKRHHGECGLHSFYTDDSGKPGYLGFHGAGNSALGYSLFVPQESLDSAIIFFKQKTAEPLDLLEVPIQLHMAIPSPMEVLKEVPALRIPFKTEIEPGPLTPFLDPPTTAPSHLRPFTNDEGVLIDPAALCLKKYSLSSKFLNPELLKICVEETYQQFVKPFRFDVDRPLPRALSMNEAIHGYRSILPLPMNKAVGATFRDKGKKKRDHFCRPDPNVPDGFIMDLTLEKAQDIINLTSKRYESGNKGEILERIFINFPKDETRDISKVKAGKGRQIASEDVVDSLEYRIRFGHMQSDFIEGRIQNGSTCGVNWASYEAEEAKIHITKCGNYIDSGDIQHFDGSFSNQMWLACEHFSNLHYYNSTPEEKLGRRNFLLGLAQALHVVTSSDGKCSYLVRYVASMASGFSGTAFFDTLVGMFIRRYNVYMTVLDHIGEHHFTFNPTTTELNVAIIEDNMTMLQGGDDGLFGVGPYLLNAGLTPLKIAQNYLRMGWIYTDEDKNIVYRLTFRSIYDVSYNGRTFVFNSDLRRHVMRLNEVSIMDRIYWKKRKTSKEEYILNIRSAILEYSTYSPLIYDTKIATLTNSCKQLFHFYDFPRNQYSALTEFSNLDTFECHMEKESSTDAKTDDCCDMPSTKMTDDGCSAMVSYPSVSSTDDIDFRDYSIADFVKKPFLFWEGSWTTANVANTILNVGTPINFNAILSANTQMANKLIGYSLMRGTLGFKILTNAQPFQAGALLIHFLPNALQRDADFIPTHNTLLAGKTQQPHVIMDAQNSSATFEVPYLAPGNWFRLVGSKTPPADRWDFGSLYITVLSPLRTGSAGATNVDVSVYTYIKDLELAGPIVPQMAGSGPTNKFNVNTTSREVAHTGPISSMLSTVSKVASSLTDIPAISRFAGPTAWMTRTLAGVASAFGYSNPPLSDAPQVVARQFNRYSATSDGHDSSYPLGILHDNSIVITDTCSIRSESETSFEFLKKVKGQFTSFTWNTSQVSGASVFAKNIQPFGLAEAGTITKGAGTATYYQGPPIYYFSFMFTYWRGSIKLWIMFFKTIFHTGRLQITWTPVNNLTPTIPDLNTGMLAQRWIVDLSESNEIEVILPWQSNLNYLPSTGISGRIDIIVLNVLRCPESVNSTIDAVVWASGGDDFEFAAPGSNYTFTPFSPQMAEETRVTALSGVIGNAPSKTLTQNYNKFSMGEHFMDLKQLLNRYCPISYITWPTITNDFSIWPWLSNIAYLDAAGSIRAGNSGFDTYSACTACFAYYRGSIKIQIRTPSPDSMIASVVNQPLVINPGAYNVIDVSSVGLYTLPNNFYNFSVANAGVVFTDKNIGVSSFQIPYYCKTRSSFTVQQTTSNAIPGFKPDQPTAQLVVQSAAVATVNTGVVLSRSAGEDFQLSYFIGCPPVLFSYV